MGILLHLLAGKDHLDLKSFFSYKILILLIIINPKLEFYTKLEIYEYYRDKVMQKELIDLNK